MLLLVSTFCGIQASTGTEKSSSTLNLQTHQSPYQLDLTQDGPNGLVIVDDTHDNDYADGDLNELIRGLNSLQYIAKFVSEFNSFEEAVSVANYLIITAPFTVFSTEEISAIGSWMDQNSANLIISSRGDYSNPNYDSLNAIFTQLGATTRVQDDNIYTSLTQTGNFYIETDNFNTSSFPELFTEVTSVNYFSPSSINPGENGQVLVRAEDHHYQVSETDQDPEVIFDNTSDGTGGSAIPLTVYEEVSVGDLQDRLLTFGTTMWSSFDYRDNDQFQDVTMFNNMLDYLKNETIATAGQIEIKIEDTQAPEVTIAFPHDNAFLTGIVELQVDAHDLFGMPDVSIKIDGKVVATGTSHTWDTTKYNDGEYTVEVTATDNAGNTAKTTHRYTIYQEFEPFLPAEPKVMSYNILQSGAQDAWFDVILEENPDMMMLIETGDFDNNNNALLNQVVDNLNQYFFDEIEYKAYTQQDIADSFNGITFISRMGIQSNQKLTTLKDDTGTDVNIPLPFLHSQVTIANLTVNLIGAHLTAFADQEAWNAREKEQEAIINYMDQLGDVPIIYMGDMNSASPDDVDPTTQQVGDDLGTEPIEMILNNSHPKASTIHTFVDVTQVTDTSADTYFGSVQSRIDYIFVNQHLSSRIRSSTTGDTPSAALGSDHRPVDVTLDFSDLITEPEITFSSTQPRLNFMTPLLMVLSLTVVVIIQRKIKRFD